MHLLRLLSPAEGPLAKEGYILDFETIYEKIRETVELGGTGVLMQGGLHPDLKIDWYEQMLRGIKQRFPKIHLHCFSASEIIAIAEYSELAFATRSRACAMPASIPSPAAARRFSMTKSATRSPA